MSWGELFATATARDDPPTSEAVADALQSVRAGRSSGERREPTGGNGATLESPSASAPESEPNPARIVADADVLATDLLRGESARDALDHVRRHSWVCLVASPILLDDAESLIRSLSEDSLASAWRDRIQADHVSVTHPAGDHPALASAAAGTAAHVLSYDEDLVSARANLSLQGQLRVSVRTPSAFDRLFDPARLYPAVHSGDDSYPGPDRDPRA